jgi:hypothetical protein
VRQRRGEHPWACRSDHEGRPARRSRQQHRVGDRLVGTAEGHALAVEERPDDLQRLGEALDAMVEGDPECVVLGLVPARAEREHQPAAGQLVDRRSRARQQPRAAERGAGDERPDRDALGDAGEPGEQCPRVPRPALGPAVAAVEEVVADPDRVEADLLRRARHGDVLGPAHDALDLRKLDPDAKRTHWRRSLATVTSRA